LYSSTSLQEGAGGRGRSPSVLGGDCYRGKVEWWVSQEPEIQLQVREGKRRNKLLGEKNNLRESTRGERLRPQIKLLSPKRAWNGVRGGNIQRKVESPDLREQQGVM